MEGKNFFQMLKASDKVDAYAPATSPVPEQAAGTGAADACFPYTGVYPSCDGLAYLSGTPSGANFSSAFIGAKEEWQGVNQDMLTLQSFTKGAKTDLGKCHKFGHKAYGAMKQWHGTLGWTANDSAIFTNVFSWTGYPLNPDLGLTIFDRNGNLQVITSALGANGVTEPAWSTVNGGLTTDGANQWTCSTSYHPLRSVAPAQIKYRTVTPLATLHWSTGREPGDVGYVDASVSGHQTVNALTGEITNAIVTGQDAYYYAVSAEIFPAGMPIGAKFHYSHVSGGAGWTYSPYPIPYPDGDSTIVSADFASKQTTALDTVIFSDMHGMKQTVLPNLSYGLLGDPPYASLLDFWGTNATVVDFITAWNANHPAAPLLMITDPNNYSASASDTSDASRTFTAAVTISKTETVYSWDVQCDSAATTAPAWSNTATPEGEHYHYYGSLTLSDPYSANDVLSDIAALHNEWKLNGKEPWRTDNWFGIMPLVQRREVQSNVSPLVFNPALTDDLTAPITNPAWAENRAYTVGQSIVDSNGNQQTCVSPGTSNGAAPSWATLLGALTGETGTALVWGLTDIVPVCTQRAWFDPAAYFLDASSAAVLMMDGAIIGSPHPDGPGAEGWFDFYFTDYRFCGPCEINYPVCTQCNVAFAGHAYAYGGLLSDAMLSLSDVSLCFSSVKFSDFMPANATHWTRNDMAHNIPRGAMIDMGGVAATNGAIFSVKAAFTRLPVPSYNFARPCGGDRVSIDELTAQCFTDGLTMQNPLPESPVPLVDQTVLVWGTATDDGIYTGCTQAANVLALGTKIASLPSDYFHAFSAEFKFPAGKGLAGIVRFPSAPAICGRQKITLAVDGTGTKITFDSAQTNLRTGDELDFSDAAMNLITGTMAVARIDDSNFTVTAAYSSISAAVWATSTSAAAWYWNDASQKFDFRYRSWLVDNRVLAGGNPTETFGGCNPDCLQFSPCEPQVFAFTPNDDADPAWHKGWFGSSPLQSFSADILYGARAQANVEFEITDLLYQPPKCPCNTGEDTYHCHEDDGHCPADSTSGSSPTVHEIYCPPPARMEARCGVVLGSGGNGAGAARTEDAPALPTDAVNGVMTWPAMIRPPDPGVIGSSYTVTIDPGARYAAELAHGSECARWPGYYYAWTLGGGN